MTVHARKKKVLNCSKHSSLDISLSYLKFRHTFLVDLQIWVSFKQKKLSKAAGLLWLFPWNQNYIFLFPSIYSDWLFYLFWLRKIMLYKMSIRSDNIVAYRTQCFWPQLHLSFSKLKVILENNLASSAP